LYESYIDKDTRNPYQFVRKINEGGYKKRRIFNQAANKVLVKDYKNKKKTLLFQKHTQYFIYVLLFEIILELTN
jgi:hypothetical protein